MAKRKSPAKHLVTRKGKTYVRGKGTPVRHGLKKNTQFMAHNNNMMLQYSGDNTAYSGNGDAYNVIGAYLKKGRLKGQEFKHIHVEKKKKAKASRSKNVNTQSGRNYYDVLRKG